MNIIRGSDKQLGPKYMTALTNSILKVILGNGYTYRGKYNTRTTYNEKDVVVYVEGNIASLKRATDVTSGMFDATKWADVVIVTGSGSVGIALLTLALTIPTDGWEETEGGDYKYQLVIQNNSITSDMYPDLTILPDDLDVAAECQLSSACQTGEGKLIIYAQSIPTEEMSASLTLYSNGASTIYSTDITLSTEGWEATESGDFEYQYRYDDSNISASMSPRFIIHPDYLDVAAACGLGTAIQSVDGALILYSHGIPSESIEGSLVMMGTSSGSGITELPIATATRLGCIKLGENMVGTADGTVNVNIDIDNAAFDNEVNRVLASDDEFQEAISSIGKKTS